MTLNEIMAVENEAAKLLATALKTRDLDPDCDPEAFHALYKECKDQALREHFERIDRAIDKARGKA